MRIAITRPVSPSLAHCQLTHLARQPINISRAIEQHHQYERLLESLGVTIRRAAAAPDLPDAVFVEDTAIVVDEIAIITYPGAPSRLPEIPAIVDILRPLRPLAWIQSPGTLDGGDVLRLNKTLFVGRSSRTNDAGITQLRQILQPWGYHVEAIPMQHCLHLKSAATALSDHLLLVNPAWLPPDAFPHIDRIEIDPAEPHAANALRIHDTIIHPADFPRTQKRLQSRGLKVAAIEYDELAKAEGAVTCCSLLLETPL